MSINRIEIEGNLTRDPEAKDAAGKTVLKFGIAHNTRRKNQSGEWEDAAPQFFDVEFWPSNPQFWLKRLGKGTAAVVFGRVKQDTWESEGQKRSKVVIVADEIVGKWLPEIGASPAPSPQDAVPYNPTDNIPF